MLLEMKIIFIYSAIFKSLRFDEDWNFMLSYLGGSGIVATEFGKSLSEKGNIIHFISYAQPARLNLISDNLFYHEVSVKITHYLIFHHRNLFNK